MSVMRGVEMCCLGTHFHESKNTSLMLERIEHLYKTHQNHAMQYLLMKYVYYLYELRL